MPKAARGVGAKQKHEIGMPTHCGMPALQHADFHVLDRQHLLDSVFGPSPSADDRYGAFRSFLIFRMVKAAKDYMRARASVIEQIAETKRWETDVSGGQGLSILEFSDAFEDCMSDLFAIGRTIQRMINHGLANQSLIMFLDKHGATLKQVELMRSKSDHMDEMIEDRAWIGGPARPFISKTGTHGMIGPWSIELALLTPLIDDLFDALKATFDPKHQGAAFPAPPNP